jgi:hypothetical protein
LGGAGEQTSYFIQRGIEGATLVRVLILSFYFEPDLCAGSFRNTALVRALSEKLASDDGVEVITTVPNRYHSFSISALENESKGNVRIRRIPLHTNKNGTFDQARAFLSYARGVLIGTRNESYDLVYASSSRLMTAVLGSIIAHRQSVPLYLDIRDIFTETISDLYHQSPLRVLLPLLRYMERSTIRRSNRVNLVSPGFIEHFKKIDSSKIYRLFTNGIDYLNECECPDKQVRESEYKEILYAGNIGEGQGLHRIIPDVARRLPPTWRIRVIGDGGRRLRLKKAVLGLNNVILEPPMPRSRLAERYRMADVLFLHLNDYPAFEKVLPSKLFEYSASSKPILAGCVGYAAKFLKENVENVAVFSPCDRDGFFKALNELRLENTQRNTFSARYRRNRISNEMVDDMLSLIDTNRRDTESVDLKTTNIGRE